jgi:hypothetical protein
MNRKEFGLLARKPAICHPEYLTLLQNPCFQAPTEPRITRYLEIMRGADALRLTTVLSG